MVTTLCFTFTLTFFRVRQIISFFLMLPLISLAQSFNITLLDNWQNDSLLVNSSEKRYNDCWGFVQNGQEYAVLGSTEGVHFFRITDENTFEFLDDVEGVYQSSTVVHRDIKYHNGYVYTVCDEGNSSLQIIDVQYLPDSAHLVFDSEDVIDPFNTVHNVFIDSDNQLLYACGVVEWQISTSVSKSLTVYTLSDPENPTLVWSSPVGFPYVHDAYVRDNIAYLHCGDNGLRVYDFSNPSNPLFIQNLDIYLEQGYNHQGWMSPDGSKFVFGDETIGKKLKNCKVNQDHTLSINNYFGTNTENNSVPHNIMLSNEFAFVAYYNEGLRVYDLRETVPIEIAHYDTYGDDPLFKMEGAWGVYSELPSGRILISDRHTGIYLFDFNRSIWMGDNNDNLVLFPNPCENEFTLKLNIEDISEFAIRVYTLNGQLVLFGSVSSQSYTNITHNLAAGCYFVEVRYEDYLGEEQTILKKLVVQ